MSYIVYWYDKYHKNFSYNIPPKTENHTDGDFAFIHDASEVRYQYYHNCNFTEVGEPFAEQPLAVAVQQVRFSIFLSIVNNSEVNIDWITTI